MKYVRIGNDIGVKWNIFRNYAPEDLKHVNAKVYLFDRNGRQQLFNYTIEDGYIQGTFYGKDQVTTGNYRLVLTENEGNKEMVTLDYIDAFVLSAKLKNMTQSGEDAAIGIKTDVVELSSTISTDKQFVDLTDYVKREELDLYVLKSELPDTSKFATKDELFSKDYNDLSNKPVIPSEYDDTAVRNLINTKQDKLTQSQIANLNADHSKYLTEHQDLSAYVKTTDLESYALKTDIPDTSNFATKDEIVPAYDDTEVRNLIAGKQDKLSEQQIANLNADHSKYLTEHQTLPDYSNTYANINHTHDQYLTEHQDLSAYVKTTDLESYALKTDIPDTSSYLTSESDPTVPAYVKSIKQSDIDAWNAATGGVDLSNYVTKTDLDAASYITADQVTYPDYSNTYANINHTHDQYAAVHHTHSEYLTEHQDLSAYVKTTDLESYAKKTELFSKDYNDLTNKPTIPSEYDDTEVRNMIAGKQDKLSASQIANLNADHSKYLTEHQTLPDYSNTYAPLEHTHDQYLTEHQDLSAYVKTTDLQSYVTKNELDAASYITADQVTYPDYSSTYANIVHTHSEYAKAVDLQSYALKTELFSKDYNDLTNKPTIPSEYDDTEVRNMIAGKQDKLSEQQIANLNADHSKYLTEHQTLPDYSITYAPLVHTHNQYLESESDPTVPAYVKSIKQSDIDAWNAATGGVDLSNYVTKTDLDAASYITADQVTYPDYSNTYANINHTHSQYLTEHQDLSAYALKTELFSKDYNDLTNKPTIPSEYDDTQVRNLIAGKQDKLNASQIANLNADHSKYLTEHQDLSAYALKTDIPDTSSYLTSESDPTVPAYVKSITEADITNWNTKYDDTNVLSRLDSIEATLGDAYTISENILNA